VYSEIDKASNLYWTMKDTYELVTRADKVRTTRSRVSTKVKEESRKLYENTNAQFGYGEITPGALTNLITILQNVGSFIESNQDVKLPCPIG